jgi:hypothetical protein
MAFVVVSRSPPCGSAEVARYSQSTPLVLATVQLGLRRLGSCFLIGRDKILIVTAPRIESPNHAADINSGPVVKALPALALTKLKILGCWASGRAFNSDCFIAGQYDHATCTPRQMSPDVCIAEPVELPRETLVRYVNPRHASQRKHILKHISFPTSYAKSHIPLRVLSLVNVVRPLASDPVVKIDLTLSWGCNSDAVRKALVFNNCRSLIAQSTA